MAETYGEQATAQEAEFQKLLEASTKLEARLGEVKQEQTELQAMLDLAKSKELTHKVVEGVAGATAVETGMDEMRDEIQRRLDKATAQGEVDASRLENQMAEALEQDAVDAQLAERKRSWGYRSSGGSDLPLLPGWQTGGRRGGLGTRRGRSPQRVRQVHDQDTRGLYRIGRSSR